jgi:hypothetical protein
MKTYVIYRYGSNAANQPLTPKAAVGLEVADSAEAATRQAAKRIPYYNNQYMYAVPAEDCTLADQAEAQAAEEARALDDQTFCE